MEGYQETLECLDDTIVGLVQEEKEIYHEAVKSLDDVTREGSLEEDEAYSEWMTEYRFCNVSEPNVCAIDSTSEDTSQNPETEEIQCSSFEGLDVPDLQSKCPDCKPFIDFLTDQKLPEDMKKWLGE